MSDTRRRLLGALALAPVLSTARADAQVFPTRTMRIVVPYPPGGFNDQLARVLAQKFGETWKQTVIVENRPGAGTQIGTDHVAKAPPDGHTLLIAGFAFAVNPSLHARPAYDAVRDFAPIALCGATPNLLVTGSDQPFRSVADLLALARAKPGEVTFASTGPGSSTHLSMELLKLRARVDIVHVPYKGSAPALVDVIGGRVHAAFDNVPNVLQQVNAGRVRALAVTSPRRFALLPHLPTLLEAGVPEFEVSSWFGLAAPGRTPREIVDRLNREVNRILLLPDVMALFRAQGVESIGGGSEQMGTLIRNQIAKWAPVVKAAGLGG
jgi:tripartite-type tricarboxylate transporter receptor subunit TctC